jgi:prepilin-type N-terminal cleavage/methylation domain-containing protein
MSARRNAGFTLAEVLVALAILGTALFVLIGAFQGAIGLQLDSENAIEERQLLEGAVSRAEVAVMTGSLSAGGEYGPRYPGYAWSFDAQNVSSDGQVPLYQVTARLQTPDGEKTLDFFCFNTGPTDQTTNRAELTGKSSVRSGAPNSGMSGSKGSTSRGGSRGASAGSSRGSSRESSFGTSRGGSRGRSSSRGGSLFQKELSP